MLFDDDPPQQAQVPPATWWWDRKKFQTRELQLLSRMLFWAIGLMPLHRHFTTSLPPGQLGSTENGWLRLSELFSILHSNYHIVLVRSLPLLLVVSCPFVIMSNTFYITMYYQ